MVSPDGTRKTVLEGMQQHKVGEDDDSEDLDWWDLCWSILVQTHPTNSAFRFYNKFAPRHMRMSLLFFEILALFGVSA